MVEPAINENIYMKTNTSTQVNKWLLPFSWLYGLIVFFRNKFFDWGILKREEFNIPIICIGNLTVGGTGKTPHTEYVVNILRNKYKVAVLSRGYGRKTNGYILADNNSTSLDIGDEPYQIKRKYPEIYVAVDAERRRGIHKLLAMDNPPQVIVLDDAFQHRYVNPSFTVILSDFNRPVYEDALLPAGRLREPISHLRKVSMVVVTKCPADLKPIDYRIISHDLGLFPYQSLFFTSIAYSPILRPVFGEAKDINCADIRHTHVLLVTGIASPKLIIKELSQYTNNVESITYPDHHIFRSKDIKQIKKRFDSIASDNKIIVVTEKDAARLVLREDIDDDLKQKIFYLPIEISFVGSEHEEFDNKIISHVKEYSRNRIVYKK